MSEKGVVEETVELSLDRADQNMVRPGRQYIADDELSDVHHRFVHRCTVHGLEIMILIDVKDHNFILKKTNLLGHYRLPVHLLV